MGLKDYWDKMFQKEEVHIHKPFVMPSFDTDTDYMKDFTPGNIKIEEDENGNKIISQLNPTKLGD